ncbi:MAG: MFS transporter, partial [Pseudogulbenkiania sp.]|nr:MFS transporter [Pseudogulbenkiania sp.]
MASQSYKQYAVLASSTLSFTVCFMIWMMFAVLGIPLKQQLGLNETEFGILAATPVLTGSLVRVPLGIWTDRFGGRIVLFVLMLVTIVPIYAMQFATQ